MDLALCMGALLLWNRKGLSPNCFPKVGRTKVAPDLNSRPFFFCKDNVFDNLYLYSQVVYQLYKKYFALSLQLIKTSGIQGSWPTYTINSFPFVICTLKQIWHTLNIFSVFTVIFPHFCSILLYFVSFYPLC